MISACLIHRDDPHLAKTVASLRTCSDITEVVIVDTGSKDGGALAHSLADRFESFTDCNFAEDEHEGRPIADFSGARARSFALATQPWLLWADSDDLLDGLDNLADAVRGLGSEPNALLLCKYEYAYEPETGSACIVQWRERVCRNGAFRWEHPVHETLVPMSGDKAPAFHDRIIWKHQRSGSMVDKERNLRILRRYAERGGLEKDEAWTRFNLGIELQRLCEFKEAREHLTRYVDISGWDDQRAIACLHLVDLCIALDPWGDQVEAAAWAERAKELRPGWSEPHHALAKLAMLRGGTREDGEEDLRAVIEHCASAIAGSTDTPLVVKPLEQEIGVVELKQAAHETLGEWEDALACSTKLLQRWPGHPRMLASERSYLARLGRVCNGPDALDIVFACPVFSDERWDPIVFQKRGCGGSETAVIQMAKRLAKMGHRVRVFGNPSEPGLYDGVEYYAMTTTSDVSCDVLVAWRLGPMLEWCDAKAKMLWVHDTQAHRLTEALALKADAILALSQWHKDNLVKVHRVHPDHVRLTRNGIDLARFEKDLPRNPHKAVYSSSPDRGLAVLVDLWPRIRARVPDAELHVYYGFAGWRAGIERQPDMQHRYVIAHIESRMAELADQGVVFHGSVDQATLADEMLSAGVWCSPHWFDETSCIGAMEAQAAGLHIVTSDKAALSETVGQFGTLIEGDWLTPEYQDAFVDAVVSNMSEGALSRSFIQEMACKRFNWDDVAAQWDAMMHELVDAAAYGSLPPYYPVAA